jgi:hypothetical protein
VVGGPLDDHPFQFPLLTKRVATTQAPPDVAAIAFSRIEVLVLPIEDFLCGQAQAAVVVVVNQGNARSRSFQQILPGSRRDLLLEMDAQLCGSGEESPGEPHLSGRWTPVLQKAAPACNKLRGLDTAC